MPISLLVTYAIISDELSDDLGGALDGCERLGIDGVELRKVHGRTWTDLADDEVAGAVDAIRERGMRPVAFATPVLKCALPGAPAPPGALHGASASITLEESLELLDRTAALAARAGVPYVRTFSGWRVHDPSAVLEQVVEAVAEAQRRAADHGVEVLLENEHDCNVATSEETIVILERIPGLRVIWDPGNHVRAGGDPAASALDGAIDRIAHVHVKDVDADGRWVPLGSGLVPWPDVVARLGASGYDGDYSLETHCTVDDSVETASAHALRVLHEAGCPA